jgi:hypothetical protein
VPFVLWENSFGGGGPFQYAILWLSGDQSGSVPPNVTRRDAASELHLPHISAAL